MHMVIVGPNAVYDVPGMAREAGVSEAPSPAELAAFRLVLAEAGVPDCQSEQGLMQVMLDNEDALCADIPLWGWWRMQCYLGAGCDARRMFGFTDDPEFTAQRDRCTWTFWRLLLWSRGVPAPARRRVTLRQAVDEGPWPPEEAEGA